MKTKDKKTLADRKLNLTSRLARTGALRDCDYKLDYEVSKRVEGTSFGGVAAMMELARATGLADAIDSHVSVLAQHRPYKESDHVLALAAAVLAGGTCPEDLRRLREDPQFLDSLGVCRLPDSTTSGDFLRRFKTDGDVENLMHACLAMSEQVLVAQLSPEQREVGMIDADGTLSPTDAECMEGIDYCGYKRQWGYAPLLVSLANTGQPLCIFNRPGNAPSASCAAKYLDMALEYMLGVYKRVTLRGDTDFSQTQYLDGWHESGRVDFVFGYDACTAVKSRAEALDACTWMELKRPVRYEVKTRERTKPERVKEKLIKQRGYRTLHTQCEDMAEFEYRPGACKRNYRMVVVRKTIAVTEGQLELEPKIRYFFYITNRRDLSTKEVVFEANKRCNQENLIAQLKGQVHALTPVSDKLHSNWAWMVSASIAWTLKSWFALFSPQPPQRKRLLGMEFRTFLNRFINIPVQIVHTARRTLLRVIGGNLSAIPVFLDTWTDIRRLARIRV